MTMRVQTIYLRLRIVHKLCLAPEICEPSVQMPVLTAIELLLWSWCHFEISFKTRSCTPQVVLKLLVPNYLVYPMAGGYQNYTVERSKTLRRL
jgi:hypothetical protein